MKKKVLVYFDRFFGDISTMQEYLKQEEADEVVVMAGHKMYSQAKKWAASRKIPISECHKKAGIYGKFAPHMMFREAIVKEAPSKIIAFGGIHSSLLSQAQVNGIDCKIV